MRTLQRGLAPIAEAPAKEFRSAPLLPVLAKVRNGSISRSPPAAINWATAGVDKERKGTIERWNLDASEATAQPDPKKDEEPADEK